jgi:hypothetical protein
MTCVRDGTTLLRRGQPADLDSTRNTFYGLPMLGGPSGSHALALPARGLHRKRTLATVVIGFNWGGWTLGSTAEQGVNTALVQVYAPVCVERFEHQANIEVKWAELTKVDSWRRDDYIKESGFATPPGSTSPNARIADACAEALSKIIAMHTPGAK